MNSILRSPATLQRWDIIHRFCEDDPGPITYLEEAQRVLTTHAGHGAVCLQYLAALCRTSEVL